MLRTRRAYRRRRRSREERIPRFTDRSKSIHDRPTTADDCGTPGRWEDDLIMCAQSCDIRWPGIKASELGRHAEFTAATSAPVYFCDPTPAQRFFRPLAQAA